MEVMWRFFGAIRIPIVFYAVSALAFSSGPYREALPGYAFAFPRDHFEHQDFKTEWWYYTGNVWSRDGRRFGFELVFFRVGERLGSDLNPSTWRVNDVYLANAALTDLDARHFFYQERFNRAGPGIAGASFAERRVWNGNWSAVWNGERQTLSALTSDFAFHLECSPTKPLVIHGENGVSQKGAGAGEASHYISFPRLAVNGSIRSSGRNFEVSGQAWMDHEWFTHQLEPAQTGWDWFSVQVDNKTELMLYELRRRDGGRDPNSSGTFIDASGRAQHLTSGDFTLKPLDWWRSRRTGARYPVRWSLSIPKLHLQLECRAKLADQELDAMRGAKYWEGAVDYSGSARGVGYLEMTGYDGALKMD
jgi:predicted secreted hydrolase